MLHNHCKITKLCSNYHFRSSKITNPAEIVESCLRYALFIDHIVVEYRVYLTVQTLSIFCANGGRVVLLTILILTNINLGISRTRDSVSNSICVGGLNCFRPHN
jgi:hypothetical protein